MKKITLISLCFGSVISAFASEWITDTNTNCSVWNSNPSIGESIKWSGSCLNGKANGNGVLQWYLNGDANNRYEGDYKDGKQHGKGVYASSNGNRYEGDYKDGKQHGKGVFASSNGDRYEGDYKDGKIHGFGIRYSNKRGVYIKEEDSEIGKVYLSSGKIIGLYRDNKIYKKFYDCYSENECLKKEQDIIDEKNKQEREWQSELNAKNPQSMYINAGYYIRDGDTSKGKELYRAIVRRFPNSPLAIKSSDQLNALYLEKSSRESSKALMESENRKASEKAYEYCMANCSDSNCFYKCKSLR